jgi:glycerol-3-phosphate cytidylyltransferase
LGLVPQNLRKEFAFSSPCSAFLPFIQLQGPKLRVWLKRLLQAPDRECMKRVLTYGTFDVFHIGHLNLLRRAKELRDYLIVRVSTDEFNLIKHKTCFYPYEHRLEIVRAIRCVDEAFAEKCWEQKAEDIAKYNIDLLVMGSDWAGEFDHFKTPRCEVIYLERTPDISSTKIRGGMHSELCAWRCLQIFDRRLVSPPFLPHTLH